MVETLQLEVYSIASNSGAVNDKWSSMMIHMWCIMCGMYWKIELETLIYIWGIPSFVLRANYVSSNKNVSSGGIQPCHFWIQFSAIPENSHDSRLDFGAGEVSPGLEKLLDLWVKDWVIPLQVKYKYGDKLEMIGKEVW